MRYLGGKSASAILLFRLCNNATWPAVSVCFVCALGREVGRGELLVQCHDPSCASGSVESTPTVYQVVFLLVEDV